MNAIKSAGRPVIGGPLFCAHLAYEQLTRSFKRLTKISYSPGAARAHSLTSFIPNFFKRASCEPTLFTQASAIAQALSAARPAVLTVAFSTALIISTPAAAASQHTQSVNNLPALYSEHSGYTCATSSSAKPESVQIQKVSDGDTVVLSDGRKVRIIGINAPELSKKTELALRHEAEAAGELVKQLIANSKRVTLVAGDDPIDRYGRVLAHIIFDNKRSLAGELLTHGLAAATAVHPNTRCAEHNQRIEQHAREQKRGVWQYVNNPWFGNTATTESIQGFHILTAVATNIGKYKNDWEIQLNNGVMVRAKAALLSDKEALNLHNKTLEVRGWFGRSKGHTSVRLHHRTNLTVRH